MRPVPLALAVALTLAFPLALPVSLALLLPLPLARLVALPLLLALPLPALVAARGDHYRGIGLRLRRPGAGSIALPAVPIGAGKGPHAPGSLAAVASPLGRGLARLLRVAGLGAAAALGAASPAGVLAAAFAPALPPLALLGRGGRD